MRLPSASSGAAIVDKPIFRFTAVALRSDKLDKQDKALGR
jgi:hypothetical protein